MAQHQVIVHNALGDRLGVLDTVTEFRYQKVANWYGTFSLSAPENEWPKEWRGLDFQYHFWRKPNGGTWKPDFVGLQRDVKRDTDNGNTILTIEGVDQNELLARRVIKYAAGSSQAKKTDSLDDMMKAIVRENLGASAGTGRNITNTFRFTVAADAGQAASITKSFAYENVLDTLVDLADTSAGQASNAKDLFFEIALTGYNGNNQPLYQFRTYINQPGVDRTYPNGQYPVVFSLNQANIGQVHHERIYSNEINYVYAGGLGLEDDRDVQEAGDTLRINSSPINRREAFESATHVEDGEVLQVVYEALNAGRPGRSLRTNILDTETTPYQIAWNHGDKVTVFYGDDKTFDEVIRVTEVHVRDKKETINGQFGFGAVLTPEVQILRELNKLKKQIKKQGAGAEFARYRGRKETDFDTTDLPRHGQYGHQVNDDNLQINLNGVVKVFIPDG